jgi:hypothetical protein
VLPHATVSRPLPAGADRVQPRDPADDAQTLFEMVTAIILDNLPEEYEDARHWGMTKEVWHGVRFSGKPFELKMNSRKKRVNHGTWRRYRITLVDPERRFRARLANVRAAGSGRVALDAVITARLHCFARLAKWESGVQLISLSTDAEADVHLRLRCEVSVRFDFADLVPAVSIQPEVTDADLRLVTFRVRRISKLDGPLVHELGKNLRGVLERKIEQKRAKMVARINRQINKHPEKLRFSVADLGRRAWDELTDLADLE